MKNLLLLYVFFLFLTACQPPEEPVVSTLINTNHLEHLYEEFTIGDTQIGTIWIYCETPDYRLVADEDEGFTCVDDVARALIFYCRQYDLDSSQRTLDKIRSLTEFLFYMQAENGFFYNFLLPGSKVNETHTNSQSVSNWWTWRAFWALSEVNMLKSAELADLQNRSQLVIEELIQKIEGLCPAAGEVVVFDGVEIPACLAKVGADQIGAIMVGLTNYYQANPSDRVKRLLLSFGNLLMGVQFGDAETWPHYAIMSWQNYWHAWGNSQAYALLYSGRILQHNPFIQAGLNEVRYFYPYCLENDLISGFKVVKEMDSLSMQDYRQFSQIAYNIRPMVFASLEAFSITKDQTYAVTAGRLATWFFGNNPADQMMYDPLTGRSFDGINSPTEVNHNSGAESTIEALLSLQAIEAVSEAKEVVEVFRKDQSNN